MTPTLSEQLVFCSLVLQKTDGGHKRLLDKVKYSKSKLNDCALKGNSIITLQCYDYHNLCLNLRTALIKYSHTCSIPMPPMYM